MNRSGLIAVQIIGGLTILPYPAVLVANVMSMAAPGQTKAGMLPWILLSAYPLVWIALYFISWRAMARGAVGLAFGLSSIPLAAALCVIGVWVYGWIGFARTYMSGSGVFKNVVTTNPVLTAVYGTGGEKRFPPEHPTHSADQAIRAIEEHPGQVNTAVAPYGTPLKVAVDNLMFDLDGSPIRDSRRQEQLVRIVRALVARGAHFAQDEKKDLQRQWRLRRAMHDGPVTTASENPLVWRILTRKRDGVTPFQLRQNEIPMLKTSTRLHGTPLYAALLQQAPDATREVIEAGGRLSPEEERDPAAAAALSSVFERDSSLRMAYNRAH